MKRNKKVRPSSSTSASPSLAQSLTQSLGISQYTHRKITEGLKLLTIAVPPITAVIVLSVMMILQVEHTLRFSGNMNEFLNQGQLLNRLLAALQKERGFSCLFLAGNVTSDQVKNDLNTYRLETDAVLKEFTPFLWQTLIKGSNISDMAALDKFQRSLNDHRSAVISDDSSTDTCDENLAYYSPMINVIIYNTGRVFYNTEEGSFWGTFDSLRMILQANDLYGLMRTAGGTFYSQGYFTVDEFRYFTEIYGVANMYLEQAGTADTDVVDVVSQQKQLLNGTITILDTMIKEISQNSTSGNLQEQGLTFFRNSTSVKEAIFTSCREMLTQKLSDKLSSSYSSAKSALYISLVIVALSLGICIPVTFYYSYQTRKMQVKVREKIKELRLEKTKSENLLFQMLPKEVAVELQAGRQVPPKIFNECTVYFSDIVGFANICSSSTPFEIVELLNSLYSTMDTVLDQYNVYKVETIGDSYMVVSGIPTSNGHEHSNQVATMALHMLKEISSMSVPHRRREKLKMRIGCNTGSCAAGVVGLKMPRYCLFGDLVNTASRMMSTGLEMRIQVTESAMNHLMTYHKRLGYTFVFRGETSVKGKGAMKTFWLKSKDRFPVECDLSTSDPVFMEQQNP